MAEPGDCTPRTLRVETLRAEESRRKKQRQGRVIECRVPMHSEVGQDDEKDTGPYTDTTMAAC